MEVCHIPIILILAIELGNKAIICSYIDPKFDFAIYISENRVHKSGFKGLE